MFPYRRKGQFKDARAQFFTPWTVAEGMARMSLMDAEAVCIERLKQAVEGNPLVEALMPTAFPEEAERFFFERLLPYAVDKAEPFTVADICCGSGVMLPAAARQFPRWAIDSGVDSVALPLGYCRQLPSPREAPHQHTTRHNRYASQSNVQQIRTPTPLIPSGKLDIIRQITDPRLLGIARSSHPWGNQQAHPDFMNDDRPTPLVVGFYRSHCRFYVGIERINMDNCANRVYRFCVKSRVPPEADHKGHQSKCADYRNPGCYTTPAPPPNGRNQCHQGDECTHEDQKEDQHATASKIRHPTFPFPSHILVSAA